MGAASCTNDIVTIVLPDGIEALVCTEIAKRAAHGRVKYGMTVAENPLGLRAWLQHALEESLDQAVYLRRAIAEIDASLQPLPPLPELDGEIGHE